MKAGWEIKAFENCIEKVTYTPKIQRKDFLDDGIYPIVSQEDAFINGYWNNEADLFKVETPIVIFGDHTKVLKYVDFDFVLGADGVKILKPKNFLLPKFLFYRLQSETLDSLGYARHYKLLKELQISYPEKSEQQRIVAILDEAFESIATAKANTEQNLKNARALFDSYLHEVFSQRGDGWEEKLLVEIAKDFGRGKSKNRPRNDPKLYGGKYPFIQTGDIRNATHLITSYTQTYNETGLAQSKLWAKGTVCITIAANIAETAILDFDACFPDSVIGITVDENKANNKFLEYLLQSFKAHLQAQGKGSAQDNINMGTFEYQLFPFPSLKEQTEVVIKLDILQKETQRLESLYQRKITALDKLKKSLLHRAFTGEL
jgi:type I restriction enzyme S subunit